MKAIAYQTAYVTEGQVAAQPDSSLDADRRGEIIKVAYRLGDRLVNAQTKLSII